MLQIWCIYESSSTPSFSVIPIAVLDRCLLELSTECADTALTNSRLDIEGNPCSGLTCVGGSRLFSWAVPSGQFDGEPTFIELPWLRPRAWR